MTAKYFAQLESRLKMLSTLQYNLAMQYWARMPQKNLHNTPTP